MFSNRAWIVCLSFTMAALLTGCPLIEKIDELQGNKPGHCEQGRATDPYFSSAIGFDQTRQLWLFPNWRGSGPNSSCDIYINVKDGQLPGDTSITPSFVRKTVTAAVERWASVIRQMGIPCFTHLQFAADGDAMTERTPRMDVEFPRAINPEGTGGRAELGYSDDSRTFWIVRVLVATGYANGNDTTTSTMASMERIISHEFGHAFGVMGLEGATGHSSNPDDVMYPYPECSELSSGDMETLRRIYTDSAYYRPGEITPTAGMQKVVVDGCVATSPR